MNSSYVAEVAELSKPDFTHHTDRTGISTSVYFFYLSFFIGMVAGLICN